MTKKILKNMGNRCTKQEEEKSVSPSQKCILNYVDKLLKCSDINSNIIPDSMEEKMYQNFLSKMIATIKLILEDLNIQVMNHRLKISLEPILKQHVGTNVTLDHNADEKV